MEQLATNATYDSRSRSSLLSSFTTWLAMTLIYSLKISANPKKTPNVFQIMRKKYISFSKDIVVGSFVNKEGKTVDVKNQLCFLDNFGFMASSSIV